jgi:6-phosphogluconolactonase
MKLKKSGQILLALVVSLGLGLCLTSCTVDFTVAYFYVTGSQYNQIGAFKVSNNTGNLTAISGSPYGSGGTNPIRELVSSTGRYLYVLNQGAQTTLQDGTQTYNGSNIAIFSVGGNGTLAPQQTYFSQGIHPIRFAFSSTGSFLYVLDQYEPVILPGDTDPTISYTPGNGGAAAAAAAGFPCPDPSDASVFHPVGDVTVFSVDSTTGRLSLITNAQQTVPGGGPNAAQLPYFPVGCLPIDFKITASFLLTADNGPEPATIAGTTASTSNKQTIFEYAVNASNGQLTTTQNTELVTGAGQIANLGTDAASKYLYVLDTGLNQIQVYTIGTNGVLQSITSSPFPQSTQTTTNGPIALTTDSKSKFLYVANTGPASVGQSNPNSQITGYTISSTNGVLANIAGAPFNTGSSPQCILEDPSNQYIYTADGISNTVTGQVLDPNSGVLTPLRNHTSYATVGTPTWCVASGHTD